MSQLTHEQKLSAARLVAARKAPFFNRAVVSLIPVEVPGFKTFAVSDGYRLFWGKDPVERWTVDQIATVLIHEVCHLLRDHSSRAKAIPNCNPKIFNVAADCEINDDLDMMGLPLPDAPCLPKQFGFKDGLTAEAYYNMLMDGSPNIPNQPECGSGAGNPTENDPGDGEGGNGEDEETAGRSVADCARIKMQVAEDIQKAPGGGRGNVSGDWNNWAAGMLKPAKVRWQDKLRRIMKGCVTVRAGLTDYSYGRTSRRQAGMGFGIGCPIMPSMVSPIPRIAVGVDTSGSMGSQGLASAVAEIDGILKASRAEVQMISCDCSVHDQRKVSSMNDLLRAFGNKDFGGGGGTDFRPLFAAVERMKPKPNIFIFITDGDGPAPAHPPKGVEVIWVLTGRYRCKPDVKWGQVIDIDDEEIDGR